MRAKNLLFILLQYLLPQHLLSRLGGRFANSERVWLKNMLIRAALSRYTINLQTAKNQDAFSYKSFNAFFTRTLLHPTHEYFPKLPDIGSPAEGAVSQLGQIQNGDLIQAKGRTYSVNALLAGHPWVKDFNQGSFATIYLAPHNYHRVHCPLDGLLTEMVYIPGKLFSVNLVTADRIENLFARNERLVFYIETAIGKLALVMVGALMVAGMKTPFKTWSRKELRHVQTHRLETPRALKAGDELGYFDFGSTVVLCFENPDLKWQVANGAAVNLGQKIFCLNEFHLK